MRVIPLALNLKSSLFPFKCTSLQDTSRRTSTSRFCMQYSLPPTTEEFFLDLMRYILCTNYVTVPFVYSYSQEQVCTQNKGKDATVFGEYRARHIVVQLVLEVILEVAETSVQNFWLITVTNGYKINFIIFFFKTPFLAPPSLVLSVAHYYR